MTNKIIKLTAYFKHDPSYRVKLLLSLALSILSGVTVMALWNWYIVPLGLTTINLAHALGIDLLVTFIVTTKHEDQTSFWDRWGYATSFAVLTLFFGWLLHFVM